MPQHPPPGEWVALRLLFDTVSLRSPAAPSGGLLSHSPGSAPPLPCLAALSPAALPANLLCLCVGVSFQNDLHQVMFSETFPAHLICRLLSCSLRKHVYILTPGT